MPSVRLLLQSLLLCDSYHCPIYNRPIDEELVWVDSSLPNVVVPVAFRQPMKVAVRKLGRSKQNASLGFANVRRLRALDAASWHDRQQAFTELFRAGSESIPTLIAGARDASPRVRAACVTLMDHLADERCYDTLEKALRDPSALVRRHAVHAVGCQACKTHPLPFDVVGALIDRVLNDSSLRVRRVAVHQLGLQPHEPRIADTLTHTLAKTTDTGIMSRARHALRAQQSPPTPGDRH